MLNKKLLIIAISALFCNVTMLAMEAGRGDKYLTSTINKTGTPVQVIIIPREDDGTFNPSLADWHGDTSVAWNSDTSIRNSYVCL